MCPMPPDPHSDPETRLSLADQSEFLEAITELLPVCLFAKDLEGRYIFANEAFVKTTNQPDVASVLGKRASDLFSKDHAALAEKEDRRILRTGNPILNRENLNKSWYGKDRYVIVSKVCVRARDGRKLGIAGITIDITQRKRDENRLNVLNQELEARNQLLEEELSLAREVQKVFVRVDDMSAGSFFDLGYRYEPSEKLSGDLIVCEPLDASRWAVLICDVMGHGIRSALVTGIVRGFYSEEKDKDPSPSRFVTDLNAHYISVLRGLDTLLFTTLTYGILDTEKATFTATSAGHHDPLWFRTREASFLRRNNRILHQDPAVGLIDHHPYRETSFSLDPEDALLFYTDGLTECCNDQEEEFGVDRMCAIVADNPHQSCNAVVDAIIRNARSFAKTLNDDLSVLLLKLPPK